MIYEHGMPAEHVTQSSEHIPVTVTDDAGQQFEGYAIAWTKKMVQAQWEVNRWVTRTAWMDATSRGGRWTSTGRRSSSPVEELGSTGDRLVTMV